MGATVDCEAIGTGLLGQPVNSLTSLVLIVSGAMVMSSSRDVWIAAALAAAGVGSFLFHGPLAPGGEWIHDVTLAWLILVVWMKSRGWERRYGVIGLAAIAPVFFAAPPLADPLTAGLVIVTLASIVVDDRWVGTLGPVALLAVSAVIGRLGSSGGPWCDPTSVLQTHGLWHVGAAASVAWWAIARERRSPPVIEADRSKAARSDAEPS